ARFKTGDFSRDDRWSGVRRDGGWAASQAPPTEGEIRIAKGQNSLALTMIVSPGCTGSSRPILSSLVLPSTSRTTRRRPVAASAENPPAVLMALRTVAPGQ